MALPWHVTKRLQHLAIQPQDGLFVGRLGRITLSGALTVVDCLEGSCGKGVQC